MRLHNPDEGELSEDDDVVVPSHVAEVDGFEPELGADGLPLAYSGLGDDAPAAAGLLRDGRASGRPDVERKSGERDGRGSRSKAARGSGEDQPRGVGDGGGGGYGVDDADDGALPPPPPPPQHATPPPPPPPKAGGAGYGAGAGAEVVQRDMPPPPPDREAYSARMRR